MESKIKLKGMPASPGKGRGLVRVCDGVKDAEKFSEGDVLVTVMTEPSMVLMMNKAVAIVTDVGGVTSHAAIVSRELGVPCVVATKTATADLKDGMEVIVDGDEGLVTIM